MISWHYVVELNTELVWVTVIAVGHIRLPSRSHGLEVFSVLCPDLLRVSYEHYCVIRRFAFEFFSVDKSLYTVSPFLFVREVFLNFQFHVEMGTQQ